MAGASFFKLREGTVPASRAGLARTAAVAWNFYQQLDCSQWLPRCELELQQLRRLRALLAHAQREVPFYRELFASMGIVSDEIQTFEDFGRLPILPRTTFQERAAEFVAQSLPDGMKFTEARATSGTTGMPVEIHQTNLVAVWWLAFYLRDLEWCGFNTQGKVASLRALALENGHLQQRLLEGLQAPYWHPVFRDFLETGPSFGMDVRQDPKRQLEWLLRIQPDYLLSYPSSLVYLASLLEEQRATLPGLKAIQTIAETLTPDVQSRIEAAFGVPVKNTYSCVEAGYLASPCPEGHGAHVHAENAILEILNEHNEPCRPGETGRVVLTLLHNFATPLIRYEIRDEATAGPEQCPCGRGLPLLASVEGKRNPLFWLPNGRRKCASQLNQAAMLLGGVRQRQFIQQSLDRILVRVVPAQDWTADHPTRIRQFVHEFFESPVDVDVQLFDQLDRPAGGKLLAFINELERPRRV